MNPTQQGSIKSFVEDILTGVLKSAAKAAGKSLGYDTEQYETESAEITAEREARVEKSKKKCEIARELENLTRQQEASLATKTDPKKEARKQDKYKDKEREDEDPELEDPTRA